MGTIKTLIRERARSKTRQQSGLRIETPKPKSPNEKHEEAAKTRELPFVFGGFVEPEPYQVSTARRLFLQAAARHPLIRLGASLDDMVLKPLDRFCRRLGISERSILDWKDSEFLALRQYHQERDRLIQGWAVKHNLGVEWVHLAALQEIGTWKAFPRPPEVAFGQFSRMYFPERSGNEWPPVWSYWAGESATAYRARALQLAKLEVDAVIQAGRRAQKTPGGSQLQHYRWAAERVCLNRTLDRIACSRYNDSSVTNQAVSKAVLPLLRELGFPSSQPKKPTN